MAATKTQAAMKTNGKGMNEAKLRTRVGGGIASCGCVVEILPRVEYSPKHRGGGCSKANSETWKTAVILSRRY